MQDTIELYENKLVFTLKYLPAERDSTRSWLIRNLHNVEREQLRTHPSGDIVAIAYESQLRYGPDPYRTMIEALRDTTTIVQGLLNHNSYSLSLAEHLLREVVYVPGTVPPAPVGVFPASFVTFTTDQDIKLVALYRERLNE